MATFKMNRNFDSVHDQTIAFVPHIIEDREDSETSESDSVTEYVLSQNARLTQQIATLNTELEKYKFKTAEMNTTLQRQQDSLRRLELRQKELIHRLSFVQVENRQLHIQHDSLNSAQIIAGIRFTIESVSNASNSEQFAKDKQNLLAKLSEIISSAGDPQQHQKAIKASEISNICSELELKNRALGQKLRDTEQSVRLLKDNIKTAEGAYKIQTISVYNDKIDKIRGLYGSLRQKVERQEEYYEQKLRKITTSKDKIIANLKSQLKQNNKQRNYQFDKHSFISEADVSQFKLAQISDAIQILEQEIFKQLRQ